MRVTIVYACIVLAAICGLARTDEYVIDDYLDWVYRYDMFLFCGSFDNVVMLWSPCLVGPTSHFCYRVHLTTGAVVVTAFRVADGSQFAESPRCVLRNLCTEPHVTDNYIKSRVCTYMHAHTITTMQPADRLTYVSAVSKTALIESLCISHHTTTHSPLPLPLTLPLLPPTPQTWSWQ